MKGVLNSDRRRLRNVVNGDLIFTIGGFWPRAQTISGNAGLVNTKNRPLYDPFTFTDEEVIFNLWLGENVRVEGRRIRRGFAPNEFEAQSCTDLGQTIEEPLADARDRGSSLPTMAGWTDRNSRTKW